jgi:hypothetical protein
MPFPITQNEATVTLWFKIRKHALKENAAAITQAWKEGLIVRKAYVPFLTLSALTLGDILDHF